MSREELKRFLIENSYPVEAANQLYAEHVNGKMFCDFDRKQFQLLGIGKGPILAFEQLKDKLMCMGNFMEDRMTFSITPSTYPCNMSPSHNGDHGDRHEDEENKIE